MAQATLPASTHLEGETQRGRLCSRTVAWQLPFIPQASAGGVEAGSWGLQRLCCADAWRAVMLWPLSQPPLLSGIPEELKEFLQTGEGSQMGGSLF